MTCESTTITSADLSAEVHTPLWGSIKKDPQYCECEGKGTETNTCGCAFGQCLNGLIY